MGERGSVVAKISSAGVVTGEGHVDDSDGPRLHEAGQGRHGRNAPCPCNSGKKYKVNELDDHL